MVIRYAADTLLVTLEASDARRRSSGARAPGSCRRIRPFAGSSSRRSTPCSSLKAAVAALYPRSPVACRSSKSARSSSLARCLCSMRRRRASSDGRMAFRGAHHAPSATSSSIASWTRREGRPAQRQQQRAEETMTVSGTGWTSCPRWRVHQDRRGEALSRRPRLDGEASATPRARPHRSTEPENERWWAALPRPTASVRMDSSRRPSLSLACI